MFPELIKNIEHFSEHDIDSERKKILQPLVDYIQKKYDENVKIRLNFICTHNSRRSHLSQIWAQTMAYYFGINNIYCYSGGTEATAMFPKVAETLTLQGLSIQQLTENTNPIYAVKFSPNEYPIICFSKVYNHEFNPKGKFAAIMTCDNADENCPLVLGAEARFSIKYEDPKKYDGTDKQAEQYALRSRQIAQEMWWVMKSIKNNGIKR